MFSELIAYFLDNKIGNAIAVFIGILLLYGLFRLVVKIIDYIVFKRLMKRVMKAIYGEYYVDEDEEDEYNGDVLPNSNQEDEQSQKKDKKREQKREAERLQEMENEFIGGGNKTRTKPKQRIVGFNEKAIIGKWTARVAKQFLQKYQGLDMNQVNELGYFQALVLAQKRSMGIDDGFSKGGGGRGM